MLINCFVIKEILVERYHRMERHHCVDKMMKLKPNHLFVHDINVGDTFGILDIEVWKNLIVYIMF